MAMTRVFVYGTLKRGLPNYRLLADPGNGVATFLGGAILVKKYPLVVYTKYNVPFLLAMEGKGENVCGEVYDVDSKMLGTLDKLEDHPRFYTRTLITCVLDKPATKELEAGTTISCETYMLHNFNKKMHSESFLSDYNMEIHKVTPYRVHEDRDPDYDTYSEAKEQ